MAQISPILRSGDDGKGKITLLFMCPGCGIAHGVPVSESNPQHWTYNNDPLQPTFRPSIKVEYNHWVPSALEPGVKEKIASGELIQTQVHDICHSFVTHGQIHFQSDCTHRLKGMTVNIPEWPKFSE